MRISEIMRMPAVTCTPTASLGDAARLMAMRNVGCVIVIDAVGEVTDIVTDRDLMFPGVAEGRSGEIPVGKRRVRRLPVVDVDGHVHGRVALDDLVRNVARQADEMSDLTFSQSLTPSLEL